MIPSARPPPPLATIHRRLLLAWIVAGGWLAGFAGLYLLRVERRHTAEIFFLNQDLPVLLLGGLILVAMRWTPAAPQLLERLKGGSPRRLALTVAALCVLVGVAGAPLVFGGYELSLDEFLADFDARIFAHGQLMAPIPPDWRAYAPALQPIYGLPVAGHAFWASAYLPFNALIRGLAMTANAQGLVNPLWTGIAVVAVFGVARRLWPDQPWMAAGAALLLASSSQVLITSMTAYAMPAHLALNLVWLWLFLSCGRWGHAGALVVAFVACGLHQLAFHPLFAAPFILQLWLDRRWSTASLYTAAYAVICLFWVFYWKFLLIAAGLAPEAASSVGGGWFVARVIGQLVHFNRGAPGVMAEELVRFITWQNPLAIALALLGAGGALNTKGVTRSLVLGVALTLAAMLVTVPSQSHGWGYRYLHGMLGSVCLLATWTWARLTAGLDGPAKVRAETAFLAACGASILILAPVRAWQAHAYVRPYARANAAVHAAPAQVVIVDDNPLWFDQGALVRNDPYLRGNPKIMLLGALDEENLRAICARYSVVTFGGRQAAALGMETIELPPAPRTTRLRALMDQLNCGLGAPR